MWDDDDQGSQGYDEAEERDFEIEYTGMSANMRGSVSVDVHAAPSPRLSSWDLRRETSLERQPIERRPTEAPLYETDKDCVTFKNLIDLPKARAIFDTTWKETEKSGKENGGWFFLDSKRNKVEFLKHALNNVSFYVL